MNKNELRNKMQSGFLEAAPDVYEAVLKAAEKNRLLVQDTESQEKDERSRLLAQDTELRRAEKQKDRIIEEDTYKKRSAFCKGNVIWGNFSKYAFSACAGFALFFICLFGMLGKNEDNIYVVMDINPSIQIVMNESCQVKKLQGLNQDGKDVVKKLEWKKKDSLFHTVDVLLEDVVKESYLREGSGMLVTVSAEDRTLYQDLEKSLGDKIDGKLEILGVSHVTTAFQYADGNSTEAGRTLLEAELAENFGADEQELQQMTVMELIQYYQERIPGKLELTPSSKEQQQELSGQNKEEDKSNTQEKKTVPQNIDKEISKTDANAGVDKAATDVKNGADKAEADVGNESDKAAADMGNSFDRAEGDKSGQQKPGGKKDVGQDKSTQTGEHNQNDEKNEQPSQKPHTSQPAVQPQQESLSQPQPKPSPQECIGSEQGTVTKDMEDKKENKNKKNKNNNKDNKNKNGKDKTNNKDNDNKDKNNKDNDNKNNNSKDNDNKVNNNRDNDNKVNNNRDNDNKVSNNRNNINRNDSSSQSR